MGATDPGRDTGVLPTIGIPMPRLNRAGTSMKIPQGAFIASGHTVERVDPATRIRHTGSADSSGDQGATSLHGMAHLDGVLDKKNCNAGPKPGDFKVGHENGKVDGASNIFAGLGRRKGAK